MFSDPGGTLAWKLASWVDKKIINWVRENVVKPTVKFAVGIYTDYKNYDKYNTDEQKVYNSNYFSSYKGKLVIRTNLDRSGSFGILFISHQDDNAWDRINTVKHEYGHTKQLDQMGIINYLIFIGIPSVFEFGDESYYRKPWEITADIYGGVDLNSRTEDDTITRQHIINGYKYMNVASNYYLPHWLKIAMLMKYY